MYSVLIVDDEKHTRDALSQILADEYDVFAAANADEAIKMLDAEIFDAVLTDLRMAGKSGMSVVEKSASLPHKPVCIMMSAYGSIDTAVEAMKYGATNFLSKPVDIQKLEKILKDSLEQYSKNKQSELEQTANIFAKSKSLASKNSNLIAKSKKIKDLVKLAEQVAKSKATVMLIGNTGTGKEVFAQLIHNSSDRANAPFVVVHCAAIPANLLESELFGFEKGAFTGALQKRIGRFEAADGGTLFLDEIGEIDHPTQVKLLRFLESKSFERLGANKSTNVDVRLVCATNKNLSQLVQTGQFREDLFYRLNVVELIIPDLKEHKEDIEPLLNSYLHFYAQQNNLDELTISNEALEILKNYEWKGNIRELRNFCEKMTVLNPSRLLNPDDLPKQFLETQKKLNTQDAETSQNFSKKENEDELIRKAMDSTNGNKSEAAKLLGISRRTLHRKLSQ